MVICVPLEDSYGQSMLNGEVIDLTCQNGISFKLADATHRGSSLRSRRAAGAESKGPSRALTNRHVLGA
jgi:hypothetical protein